MTMIIIFQLGNLGMRNKGTFFGAQTIPTYHQTPIMFYRKPLSLRHSPHTLSTLSSGINLVLIVQLYVIATNSP